MSPRSHDPAGRAGRAGRADRARPPAALAALVALVATLALAVACGPAPAESSDPPTTIGTTTTTAPSTTTTTTASMAGTTEAPASPGTTAMTEEQQVLAAYQAFWDTWLAANDPPNPDHPGLRRYYTGPALDKALSEIRKNRDLGVSLRLPEPTLFGFAKATVTVDGMSAVLVTCLVDDGLVVSSATGTVIDSSVVNSDIEAHLQRLAYGWAVSENRNLEKRTGPTCA